MEFIESLQRDLSNEVIHPKVLLSKFRMLDEDSRYAPAYQDPAYLPFYYHLGKYIHPENLVDIGFGLGLNTGCFLKSCHSVKRVTAFQEISEFYSPRLATKNLRDLSKDLEIKSYSKDQEFLDEVASYKQDLVFVNEKLPYDRLRDFLTVTWNSLNDNGMVVVDYLTDPIVNQAFIDFSKIENRNSVIFETRYRTGVLIK